MQVYENFVIVLLLTLTVSGKSEPEKYPSDPDHKPHGYSFSYAVNDIHTGDIKNQWEIKQDDVVNGSYSVVEADGSVRTVEYTADDKNGFRAVLKHSNSAHTAVQNDLLDNSKLQLSHVDVNSMNSNHVLTNQATQNHHQVKVEDTIDEYKDNPEFSKLSPTMYPYSFKTFLKQEEPKEIQNIYNSEPHISTVVSNDESENLSSYTTGVPIDVSSMKPNEEIIPIDMSKIVEEVYLNSNQNNYFYPLYQYHYQDVQEPVRNMVEPAVSSTGIQSSNNISETSHNPAPYIPFSPSNDEVGVKYTSGILNQYQILSKMPSYTKNLFEPNLKLVPIDLSTVKPVESNLNSEPQKQFYPWYRYGEIQDSRNNDFQAAMLSTGIESSTKLMGTTYKSPDLWNYGTSGKFKYPFNKNIHNRDKLDDNMLSLIINKQLESQHLVDEQKSKATRFHPKFSNNEYVTYAKTIKYLDD